MNSKKLSGKVALITGGGTGIGLRCAQWLNALGAKVCLLGRRLNVCEDAIGSLKNKENGFAYLCDIRSKNTVEKAVQSIVEQHNKVDFLINETIELPISFVVGSSFIFGSIFFFNLLICPNFFDLLIFLYFFP